MHDIEDLKALLSEISCHIKCGTRADRRLAADKLAQLASLASTIGLTIRPRL